MEKMPGQTRIALPSHIPQFDGLRGIAILTVFIAQTELTRALDLAVLITVCSGDDWLRLAANSRVDPRTEFCFTYSWLFS
jgi:peptidoglycan/LPS O-acetylase OafA/YrhL